MAQYQSHETDELVRLTSGYMRMPYSVYVAKEICFFFFFGRNEWLNRYIT